MNVAILELMSMMRDIADLWQYLTGIGLTGGSLTFLPLWVENSHLHKNTQLL